MVMCGTFWQLDVLRYMIRIIYSKLRPSWAYMIVNKTDDKFQCVVCSVYNNNDSKKMKHRECTAILRA